MTDRSRKYQSILNEVLKLYEENPQSMSGKAGAERILQDIIDKKKDPLLTVKKLRDKFASLHKTLIETGNPSCPEDVKRAKRVFRDMQNHAVNSQTAAELEAYNDAPPPYEGGDYDDPYELASTSQPSQEGSSSQPSQEGSSSQPSQEGSTPQASQSTPQSTPAAGGGPTSVSYVHRRARGPSPMETIAKALQQKFMQSGQEGSCCPPHDLFERTNGTCVCRKCLLVLQ